MYERILSGGTVASRVTEQLREDIVSKRIEAGSRITIKEISERYGVSNMPVREAFRTLEGEMLLEMNAYRGATVLRIDEGFIRDVYGLLRALECLIYETALPHIDEKVLSKLHEVNEQIKTISRGESELSLYLDQNTKFHGILMSLGNNAKARELYDYHHNLIRTMRKSYYPVISRICSAAAEHDALISALAAKDVIAIKRAVDVHVNHAMENFLNQYSGRL